MQSLFTTRKDQLFGPQTAVVRLIQYFTIGVVITLLTGLASYPFVYYRVCDICVAVILWPGLLIMHLTWPMCEHTGIACVYLGLVSSVPIYGFIAYVIVRLLRKARGEGVVIR